MFVYCVFDCHEMFIFIVANEKWRYFFLISIPAGNMYLLYAVALCVNERFICDWLDDIFDDRLVVMQWVIYYFFMSIMHGWLTLLCSYCWYWNGQIFFFVGYFRFLVIILICTFSQ